MEKAYNEIVFKNNQSPDLDEDNLNRISHGLSTVDDRVIQLKGDFTALASNNILFHSDIEQINVSSAYSGKYIDLDVSKLQVGDKVYVGADHVENCMGNQAIRLVTYVNGSQYGFSSITATQLNNGEKANVSVPNNMTRLLMTLYRNDTGQAVASGTTTFTNVNCYVNAEVEKIYLTNNVMLDKDNSVNNAIIQNRNNIALAFADKGTLPANTDLNNIKSIGTYFLFYNRTYVNMPDDLVGKNCVLNVYKSESFIVQIIYNYDALNNSYIRKANGNWIAVDSDCYKSNKGLATDTDLNTVDKSGAYMLYYNRTYDNMPNEFVGRSCVLTVDNSDGFYIQSIYDYNEPSICYIRRKNGIWQKSNSSDTSDKYWKNKKIVWFGTSIPNGMYDYDETRGYYNTETSYPKIVGSRLGATVYNEAVGSSAMHTRSAELITETNPYGYQADFEYSAKTFSDSLEMKEWLIAHWNDAYWERQRWTSMTEAQKNQIRNWSWENKLNRYLTGGSVGQCDLYVFDHGYNDSRPSQRGHNYEENKALYGEDNLYSFHGACNYLLRKIFTDNPKARVIWISHYTKNYSQTLKELYEMQKEVCEDWDIHFVLLCDKLGWSNKEISVTGQWVKQTSGNYLWVEDGIGRTMSIKDRNVPDKTHPFMDKTGYANISIANALATLIETEVR